MTHDLFERRCLTGSVEGVSETFYAPQSAWILVVVPALTNCIDHFCDWVLEDWETLHFGLETMPAVGLDTFIYLRRGEAKAVHGTMGGHSLERL